MSCSHELKWYELIPIISFIIQRGRCRKCTTKISWQYLLVELSTGIIFTLISIHFLKVLFFSQNNFIFLTSFFMLIFSILIVIAVYDIMHKIIPDKLVFSFAFLTLVSVFINQSGIGQIFILPNINVLLAGPLLALPFALLWAVSKGKWIGLGDAKLILGIGWMLGIVYGATSLLFSFWIGTIISLLLIFFSHKKVSMKMEIPFAPFLILGMLIVFFLKIDLFSLSRFFNF
jgi:leader peptidase (prepilin peptidase)/N-methyltransferase